MEDSPECTGIYRMKKTYDDFMSLPIGNDSHKEDSLATRLRFDGPDPKRARLNHSSRSTASLSMARLIEKEKEERLKDADLIKAKSRITGLEREILTLKTNQEQAHIELEEQLDQMRIERENDAAKMEDLRSKLKFLSQNESDLRTEVADARKQYNAIKQEYENKLLSLQKEKFEKDSESQQKEDSTRQMLSKLRTEKCRTEAELNICQSELEEANERCQTLQKRVTDLLAENNELETLRIKAMNAEQKAGDLQRELANYHDDTVVVRAMREKISSHADLMRDNRRLKDEIDSMKRHQDNILLKEEEIISLKKRCDYMETANIERAKVQAELEEARERLQQWETINGSTQPQCLADLNRKITEVQSKLAIMTEKNGQLQASLNSAERLKQNALDDLNQFKSRGETDQGRTTALEDQIRRLKKRMLILTRERDGYRKTLDSIEGEMTTNIRSSSLSESRVHTLEETIKEHCQHIEMLETQIRKSGEEIEHWRRKAQPSITSQASVAEHTETIAKLKARLEEYELYMEQRNMKGDYDPSKTKVLHLRLNPASLAQEDRARQLDSLREENAKLRHALALLEEKQGAVHDLSQMVGGKVHEPSSSNKQLDDMKSQLTSAELKNKRLMEMFTKTSREYREIYYLLTGYKVTVNNHNVKVMSLYSEGPDDFLMFQYRDNTLHLMENEYTASLADLAQQYLLQHGSIPAFLAALTLDLFSKQTIMLS